MEYTAGGTAEERTDTNGHFNRREYLGHNRWSGCGSGAAGQRLGKDHGGDPRAIRAPDTAQDDRLAALEKDVAQIKQYLDNDKRNIDRLTEGDRVTKHAILALLGHGIDGNNVDEMLKSKHEMEIYLINR